MENNNIDNELVPFFKSRSQQIKFEFFYLIITFLLSVITIFLIHFKIGIFEVENNSKLLFYALIGGFLGGWTLDAKWFYRTTARGKHNQYKSIWESHKFYWRILIPFLSALIAFIIFILISTDSLPFVIKNKDSGRVAFGFSFLFGYFSDIVMSKFSKWLEATMENNT